MMGQVTRGVEECLRVFLRLHLVDRSGQLVDISGQLVQVGTQAEERGGIDDGGANIPA